MTDKTKDTGTNGADVKVTAPAMPDAANYTSRADYNRDKKVWDNAVWLLTHPTDAKVKKINGKVTAEAAQEAAKGLTTDDLPDCVKDAIQKELEKDGATTGSAWKKVLTYHYNYHMNGVAKYTVFLAEVENWV